MKESDLDAAHSIETQANAHPWTKQQIKDCLLNQNNPHNIYDCKLAYLENKNGDNSIVGYAVLSSVVDEITLLNICISTSYQGQGYGRLLLEHLLGLAFKKEQMSLFLEVRSSNQKAISLYESADFQKVAERKDYYPLAQGRENALIYRLKR